MHTLWEAAARRAFYQEYMRRRSQKLERQLNNHIQETPKVAYLAIN